MLFERFLHMGVPVGCVQNLGKPGDCHWAQRYDPCQAWSSAQ
jgi:hypothetical protein